MKKLIIGIDPGASGGLAVFYPDGKAATYAAKKEHTYSEILCEIWAAAKTEGWSMAAYVESLSGFQGAGRYALTGRQAFIMGTSYGRILGALEALKIPFWTVTPLSWQKTLPLPKTKIKQDHKRHLCDLAKQRFPELKPTLQTCDAILIAEYARKIQCS